MRRDAHGASRRITEFRAAIGAGVTLRRLNAGGRTRVTDSALSRVLRRPNSYETSSSFMLNAVHSLYSHGNFYALVLRNNRFEVAELHLMNARASAPMIVQDDDSAVFYRLGGNAVIERKLGQSQILVPDRDVLHVALRASHRSPCR